MEEAGRKSFTAKDVEESFGGWPGQTRQRQRFKSAAKELGWVVASGRGRGVVTTFKQRD